MQAKRLLWNHPRELSVELKHLQRTCTHQSNGYPEVIAWKWMTSFERELSVNPTILDLPVQISLLRNLRDDQGSEHRQASLQPGSENGLSGQPGRVPIPWAPTLFCPYVPGISERLRMLSARFGIRHWQSYGGKL